MWKLDYMNFRPSVIRHKCLISSSQTTYICRRSWTSNKSGLPHGLPPHWRRWDPYMLLASSNLEKEDKLHFETDQDGFEGVVLLGIPIEKEDSYRLIHMLILKQLAKTIKTWETVNKFIMKKHQKAQILTFCLRTRFYHFCRPVRPSMLKTPAKATLQELQKREDTKEKYRNLPEMTDDQSIIDYIDSWFLESFLGVTDMWEARNVSAPNQIRATFPRWRGEMGFAALKDVIPGAFAAAMLECFFPRGLTEFGTHHRMVMSVWAWAAQSATARCLIGRYRQEERTFHRLQHLLKGSTSKAYRFVSLPICWQAWTLTKCRWIANVRLSRGTTILLRVSLIPWDSLPFVWQQNTTKIWP